MSLRVYEPDDDADEQLRDEVEEMFAEESRKGSRVARMKFNAPPGYHDDKKHAAELDGDSKQAFEQELREIEQLKREKKRKRGK